MTDPADLIATRARLIQPAGRACVVAIDGRAGSGKTTLAVAVAAALDNCPVVHMDELYAGWSGAEAGSRQLIRDVLRPLARGERSTHRRFDWHSRQFEPTAVQLPRSAFVVVEGVLSSWGAARGLVDVAVWLDAPAAVRKRRALARDGDLFAPHWDDWAAQEEALLSRDDPSDRADLVLSTWQDDEHA